MRIDYELRLLSRVRKRTGVLSNRGTKQQRDTTAHVRETDHYVLRVTLGSFPLAASGCTESHVYIQVTISSEIARLAGSLSFYLNPR